MSFDQTAAEINRIVEKIDRDNRILAEMEKPRNTIGTCCIILIAGCTESCLRFVILFGLLGAGLKSHKSVKFADEFAGIPLTTSSSRRSSAAIRRSSRLRRESLYFH